MENTILKTAIQDCFTTQPNAETVDRIYRLIETVHHNACTDSIKATIEACTAEMKSSVLVTWPPYPEINPVVKGESKTLASGSMYFKGGGTPQPLEPDYAAWLITQDPKNLNEHMQKDFERAWSEQVIPGT